MMIIDKTALRLAAVVASSEDAIISQTPDGVIDTWNTGAERLFGYTAAEAIGMPIASLLPEPAALGIPTINVGPIATPTHVDTVGVTRTGEHVQLSVAVSPILAPDGTLVGISHIARNITEQKRLQREAFRLKAIVDSSDDAIVSKDLNGIVQTWNRAAERMFGWTAEEMIGQSILRIIPADRRAEEDHVLSQIRAGRRVTHFETIRQRKDGSQIEISLSVSPVHAGDGTVIGASKIARDISEQRRLAREAEEANRVKDQFLATLSHELRTPLNAVLGYTRMLREGHYSGVREDRVIEIIERNAGVLSQLVSDVLDVSSIVTGKIQLKPAPHDVAMLLQAAVDTVRPSADAKGVAMVCESRPSQVPLICDGDRLQQVFWNLLSNAVKFTPGGGRVSATLVAEASYVEATVADTGAGIEPRALPYVFQRFWQGESPNQRQTGGLGLGLALARHFTELHGGTITAHSDGPGTGATFTVLLPRRL